MNQHSPCSRRQFLARTATATTAAALANLSGFEAFGAAPFAPPLAVFSKVYQELKLDFTAAAEVTAEAGLEGVDCPVRPGGEILPERAAEDMPRYAEALRKRGAGLLLLTTGIVSPSSPHAEAILRTAKTLGIRYYRLGAPTHQRNKPVDAQRAELRSQLKELAALNREIGITAVFQNHSPGGRVYFGGDLGEMYELVKDFHADQIGVAFDLGHALIVHGDDWTKHFERLKSHIRVAYVKDTKRKGGFVPFGQGEFGQTDFFPRLKALNLSAPLSVHIEFDWAGKGNPKTRAALVQALKDCRRVVRQWTAGA